MVEHLANPITYLGGLFAVLGVLSLIGRKKLHWQLSSRQFFYGAVFMFLMGVVAAYSLSLIPPDQLGGH